MMATQMPIPQEYDRYVDPVGETEEEDDESLTELLSTIADSDVEELEDGSAIVKLGEKDPEEDPDFYLNIAENIRSYDLDSMAIKFLDFIEKDKEAREDRDKQYEDGIRRTGLGNDAPGGAQFMGASKVVHPVMAEACVDFAAKAIKELFPPDGPVRSKIIGESNQQKIDRADRKRDYMNWQLTEQIEEYRDEEEQMLTQLPLGGSQYMKMWYNPKKRRPCAEFVPIDNIYLPFAAGNFYTAERVTEVQDITQEMFDLRVDSGMYLDLGAYRVSMEPDQTKAQKATDKIEGRKDTGTNVDGIRRVFHIMTWLELEDDGFSKGERAPYLLMIDENERAVVGLYRNWEDGDDTYTKLDHIIEFKFIPWRGAYAIGLPHLIGGLSAALTGTLRALLDSAHISNAATMLKLKGGKISGQSPQIEVTQVTEIEGAPGVDDVRKIAMPMPFSPPSPVLFSLLGWLTDAAKGVVTTSEEKIADVTSNAPVGTTQALIEQGAAVFSSIHARLHDSQRRVFKVLARLNRWHLDDQQKGEVVRDLKITKEDFETNSDILPVSDPHIFAESQRYAQIQTLAARAQANPDLYDRLEVEKRILKQIKLPDVNAVLPDKKEVKDMNAALENVAMSMGEPVGAFSHQDHLAHLETHLMYAIDPNYGMSQMMAPLFIPAALEHFKEHMTMWYLNQIDTYASVSLDAPFDALKAKPLKREAQQLLATTSQHVYKDSQEMFGKLGQVMQQMQQMMQKISQGAQQADPDTMAQVQALTQTAMAETQRRAQRDQAEMQIKQAQMQQSAKDTNAKLQADLVQNSENNLTQERIKSAELTRDAAKLQHEQLQTVLDAQNRVQQTIEGTPNV